MNITKKATMKSDLDKLLDGEEIYRHEDLKEISDKWESLTNYLQFGTLGLLFASMFLFDNLPKATVKSFIYYWAGVMFVFATVAFLVSRVSLKHKMKYLNAEGKRVSSIFDQAIEKVRKK